MARSKAASWLVLLVYLLVGAVQLVHAFESHHHAGRPSSHVGPQVTADHPSRCHIPSHDHSPIHDDRDCQICQLASAPVTKLVRSPLVLIATQPSAPLPVAAWDVPAATTPTRLLARAPPAA